MECAKLAKMSLLKLESLKSLKSRAFTSLEQLFHDLRIATFNLRTYTIADSVATASLSHKCLISPRQTLMGLSRRLLVNFPGVDECASLVAFDTKVLFFCSYYRRVGDTFSGA